MKERWSWLVPGRSQRLLRRARQVAEAVLQHSVDLEIELDAPRSPDDDREAALVHDLALAAEAARRGLQLEPFPEQLMAAALMHRGFAVEMLTGEGKTLAIALASVPTALRGRSVRVMTTNAYLAQRDCQWMSPLFEQLRLDASVVWPGQTHDQKRAAYQADVTYGSASELAFDSLHDQLQFTSRDQLVTQADLLIIDEVDAIAIDGATTPFVIGQGHRATADLALTLAPVTRLVEGLTPEKDFRQSDQDRWLELTDDGLERITQALHASGLLPVKASLYDEEGSELLHLVTQCLHAQRGLERDRDYLVTEEGRVEIIDQATGRTVPERRWSLGLHQAVEAKERVEVRPSSTILARSSIAAIFDEFPRRAGITGTARGIEEELELQYDLSVLRLPPRRPLRRNDEPDQLFTTEGEKLEALLAEARRCWQRGQPVLIGTTSEASARRLSARLTQQQILHATLTAHDDAREAATVARAGAPGAVTITTQVAGRGTDIRLGAAVPDAAEAVCAVGGLRVLAAERHHALRLDDQLRGRSGRQGDPGSTRFYVSLEDDLLRRHGAGRLARKIERQARRGPLDPERTGRLVDEAQAIAESRSRQARALRQKVDAILDEHQQAFYTRRQAVLVDQVRGVSASKVFLNLVKPPIQHVLELLPEGLDRAESFRWLERELYGAFGCLVEPPPPSAPLLEHLAEQVARCLTARRARLRAVIRQVMLQLVQQASEAQLAQEYRTITGLNLPEALEGAAASAKARALTVPVLEIITSRSRRFGPRRTLRLFRLLHLRSMDTHWQGHLEAMAALQDTVALLALAERDPIRTFRQQAHALFQHTFSALRRQTITELLSFETLERSKIVALERKLCQLKRRPL